MPSNIDWPRKTREIHSHHFDSTAWNDLRFRDDDIVIATYGKSGTTWTQQIVGQLIFGGDPELAVAELSPWLDLRVPPKEIKLPLVEAQTHRRFLKTHLPVDALRFSPRAKYIYVARDARDVVWSLYNHHANANQLWYDALNKTPGLVGPPIEPPTGDIRQYWHEWLARDGHPFWPFWTTCAAGGGSASCRRVAAALRGPQARPAGGGAAHRGVPRHRRRSLARACDPGVLQLRLDEEERRQGRAARGAFWDAGADTFMNKGTNGRWRDTLSADEAARYEQRAEAELGADCARWLASGEP